MSRGSDLTKAKDLRERIIASYRNRERLFEIAKRFVEIGLVIMGSTVAAGAALFSTGFSWPPSAPQIVAITGLAVSLVGAIFIVLVRRDEDHLHEAHQALVMSEENDLKVQRSEQLLGYLEEVSFQLRSLYFAYGAARNVLERSIAAHLLDEQKLIADMLLTMRLELRIALGFRTDHTWTIVVYRSELDKSDGYNYLRCIAHDRSIECDMGKARRWREGIGVAGMALAKNDEIVAPDILEPAAVSLFSLNGDWVRKEDLNRYRSMFAVPILVGTDTRPWGVVLASCSDPGHFLSPDDDIDEFGALNNKEAVRAMAGVVALAVAACRPHTNVTEGDGLEGAIE